MQYTTHYNLNLPEGTDIVNPLVQDNPNYTAIDTALYNNKLRVIGSASEVKSGTAHAITRSDSDINVFRFVATSNYATGDTFTVDGVSVTAVLPDGTNPKNGAFVINASVLCILDGTRLALVGLEGSVEASTVGYNNSNSGLSANNVNDAIDEVVADSTLSNEVLRGSLNLGSVSTSENIYLLHNNYLSDGQKCFCTIRVGTRYVLVIGNRINSSSGRYMAMTDISDSFLAFRVNGTKVIQNLITGTVTETDYA